ncbi:FAD/NAD(P)-binding domain-containing protein [Choiromyces venosus 120613-1]|uniref:FAD/NAD(P)-binding domain-containing protein n=1 Tax=Choiromyces venosus 120613-1 TaxID=1336337 RepID=A0A3N4JE33_9PEZI|nr:FAD/NAD(P)-binding domain-containing protein [Choiromyces venosus 120613-1]
MTSTYFDVIIVGAGPFGIIAAKTYLELNPKATLALLESDTSLGGAWSKNRIYPGMYSQSPLGMIEFSDVPMKPTPQQYKNYVPAHHVYEYLVSYAATHIYDGKSIEDRIHLDTRVVSIQKLYGPLNGTGTGSGRRGSTWVVGTDCGQTMICSKLMIATGITSRPYIPFFNTLDFTPPILHTKDLARLALTFMESEGIRNVIVIGGSKSAFDAVHMFVSAGKRVDWVIRDKGSGPAGMSVSERVPVYYENSHQILSTRLMSKMSPCVFQPRDGWMRFFHQTKVGRWVTDMVWNSMQSAWFKAARYDRSDDMSRLRPQLP